MEIKINNKLENVSPFARRSRDWMILFIGAAFGALLLAFLNWFLFVRHTPLPLEQAVPHPASFSREKLDEILSTFEQRKAQYESVRRALPVVADPAK